MSSSVWLNSLSIIPSKSIDVAARGIILTFLWLSKIPLSLSLSLSLYIYIYIYIYNIYICIYTHTHTHTHIFFIHSSADGHLEMHFLLMFTSGGWAEVGWESSTQSLRDAGWWKLLYHQQAVPRVILGLVSILARRKRRITEVHVWKVYVVQTY